MTEFTKQELIQLRCKIDHEGGLTEFVIHYGGELPESAQDLAEEFETAHANLEAELELLFKEKGLEYYA